MPASTTIAGNTIANPLTNSPTISREVRGEQMRMADGSLSSDLVITKKNWGLKWERLTQAERDILIPLLEIYTSQTFSPPHEAAIYNIKVEFNSLVETPNQINTTTFYDIEVTLLEA